MPFGRASLSTLVPGNVLLGLPHADEAMSQLIVNALTNMTRNSTQAANLGLYSRFTYPYDRESFLHTFLWNHSVCISFGLTWTGQWFPNDGPTIVRI